MGGGLWGRGGSGNVTVLLVVALVGWLAWRGAPHFLGEVLSSEPRLWLGVPRWVCIWLIVGAVAGTVRIYFVDCAEYGRAGPAIALLADVVGLLLTVSAWLLIRRVWRRPEQA